MYLTQPHTLSLLNYYKLYYKLFTGRPVDAGRARRLSRGIEGAREAVEGDCGVDRDPHRGAGAHARPKVLSKDGARR